ncbi:MAG: hypothetical protein IPP04_14610 [Saprospiraceae bacterium]|nr:hypothetical protein [Saprospiraceae bacterium]
MNKIILKGLIAGGTLLLVSYLTLFLLVKFMPGLAEQYYDPMFSLEGDKAWMFFIHPFIISFALAWFWSRFKSLFEGNFWFRGFEVGVVYALIAILPSMWMIYSAFNVTLPMVISWSIYGTMQAIIAGIISAKLSPN